MIRTSIFGKCTDSDASPYITQKDVILCRSGIQLYHKSELQAFMQGDNKPAQDKEWYREYRPANVVVKAQDLCKALPVTKEHPDVWVTSKNWKDLAGGTTDNEVEIVSLDDEAGGEIGIKSSLTFYDEELYNYYLDNKEVSLGYTCKKHWVDNPDEVGYDIILDEITEVNHLAITRSGRGGSKVAVIDSILGGMKPMRTGIFAFIKSKIQKDTAPSTFGQVVFTALKNSKGTTEEELAVEVKGVLDSCKILKDCKEKNTLMDVVRDCFDNKEDALANEEELTKTLDSMYVNISGDSLEEIVNVCVKLKGENKTESKVEDTTNKDSDSDEKKDEENKDSDEKKDEENKDSDSDEKKDEENKDADSDEKKDEDKDGCNKDSSILTKEVVASIVKDSMNSALKPMVMEAVKECLGMKLEGKTTILGSELDSVNRETQKIERDYSEFLD